MSAILCVISPKASLLDVACDEASDLKEAALLLSQKKFSIILAPMESFYSKEFNKAVLSSLKQDPQMYIILTFSHEHPVENLKNIINSLPIYKILFVENIDSINRSLLEALEKKRSDEQAKQMHLMLEEQNQQLLQLQKELEEHIEKRQKYLIDSRAKLFETNQRQEIFRGSLLSILQSTSVGEMEKKLNHLLSEKMGLSWVRILFKPQDEVFLQKINEPLSFHMLSIPIYQYQSEVGSVVYLKPLDQNFKKEDKNILIKITEAVTLSLDRLGKLELTKELKHQWEATFDAISNPLILVDSDYELIQHNKSFLQASQQKQSRGKCYKVFFNLPSPCVGCRLGEAFHLPVSPQQLYDVHSNPVSLRQTQQPVYVNLYQDVTENRKLEKQILENSKAAELGTIASSIAHELNNPLGGILAFLQLIKMDMDKNSSLYADIDEMEKGVHRCKDIVQNLLSFAHNQASSPES